MWGNLCKIQKRFKISVCGSNVKEIQFIVRHESGTDLELIYSLESVNRVSFFITSAVRKAH